MVFHVVVPHTHPTYFLLRSINQKIKVNQNTGGLGGKVIPVFPEKTNNQVFYGCFRLKM